ncbi:MAG: KAP family NTPase [Deltaproteobacteria bacterium]|jgi:hypothetical protein|nr:KAP family NTPase [Deltaproteobacteria bacterium]
MPPGSRARLRPSPGRTLLKDFAASFRTQAELFRYRVFPPFRLMAPPSDPLAAPSVNAYKEAVNGYKTITNRTPYKRFVCFVDDLDRVEPQSAVEILDVIKNIFEIQNCIFVLAIDFEVVVKGLKHKFGEKTEENEREYRQYFDKIIQVPFTMPVQSYKDHLEIFIRKNLLSLGYDTDESWDLKVLKDVAYIATGGVPRAIKRIINTMSLMLTIDEESHGDMGEPLENVLLESEQSQRDKETFLKTVFIVVSLHIHFPEVYLNLVANHNYLKWNFENCKIELNSPKDVSGSVLAEDGVSDSESWKKVLSHICLNSKDQWIKQRSSEVLDIFNALCHVLNVNADDGLNDYALDTLSDVLGLVKIVSIDQDVRRDTDESDIRNDSITHFFKRLHQNMKDELPWAYLPEVDAESFAEFIRKSYRNYDISCGKESWPLQYLEFFAYVKSPRFGISLRPKFNQNFKKSHQHMDDILKALSSRIAGIAFNPSLTFNHDNGYFFITFKGLSIQDLVNSKDIKSFISLLKSSIELFRDVCKDIIPR